MDMNHTPTGGEDTLIIDRDFLAKIIPDDGVYVVFKIDHQTGGKAPIVPP